MVVIDRVEDFLAVAPELDKPCCAQYTQLMRYCRLPHYQTVGDVADAHFLRFCKQGENFDAGWVAQCFEEIGETLCCIWIDRFYRDRGHAF